MDETTGHGCAHVIYRATVAGGREAQIHLAIDPTVATAADAWARLTSVYQDVDPLSLEIEVRSSAPSRHYDPHRGLRSVTRPPAWKRPGGR